VPPTAVHSYGPAADQFCELFAPANRIAGVVVVIHGGYWRTRYDRTLMSPVCDDLALRGWAALNVEYRRVGNGGGWPSTFLDVAAAVDLVADIVDLRHVGVAALGHSAGGQLALWAAARPGLPAAAPGAAPRVKIEAVVSQAGVADLALAAGLSRSAEPTRALLGGGPADVPARYALASPRERIPLGVPQLVLHGDCDESVPLEISRTYVSAARAANDACDFALLPETGHFEHLDPASDAWQTAVRWLDKSVPPSGRVEGSQAS
jgi:acetyl esterase/lipase